VKLAFSMAMFFLFVLLLAGCAARRTPTPVPPSPPSGDQAVARQFTIQVVNNSGMNGGTK